MLRDGMPASALLDHGSQAMRFGAALRACWQRWGTAENSSVGAVRPEFAI
jgi:hypothetical protein